MQAIIISGVAGAGKSVLCEKLSQYFSIKYLPTSGILRRLMEKELDKKDIKLEKNTGFWETKEGRKFIEERNKNTNFDKRLDDELLSLIDRGDIVIDSWTMPWISNKGIKIWLKASDKIRFERLALRNNKSIKEIEENIKEKEKNTSSIYKKLYGFEWGKDLSVFDIIIDTDNLDEQEVFEIAKKKIENLI